MTDDEQQQRALAAVGREVLAFELETIADDLHVEFNRAAKAVQNADRITEDDVQAVQHTLERADMFVDTLYDACPNAERPPRLAELMTREEGIEVTERSSRNPGE
ncbi:hypothetical protein [Natrinema altunense]|uniref:Uncharacterized protein n=1 Tax=Natrinema altunense TaxID=222984 RepID=A0A482Y310_9EURY|nr:hypothetical protein [Natrinema altunense]RZH67127.1 hypothetical protein ELS17_15310 [Natrinema altunense]